MNKEEILAEIRRTAEDNGGRALGRQRFLGATGIRESDWQGKYWVRWSEAVREAGVEPNSLQGAYTDACLLESYARIALKLDRIPVASELKLHARLDPAFPSHNTFARFGTKRQLLARLHRFVIEHDEFAALTTLCEPFSDMEQPVDLSALGKGETLGFVYLIKVGHHYKIGRTNALGRRERELAIQLPQQAKTIHAIRTDDPVGIEAYWHGRFAAQRKNGEWFELSAQDVVAFRRRKIM